jgi:Lon-like protease
MTDKEIMTTPSVELDTKSIGGPSAGLMMALEIYNQLTEEDITKGHKIAGTGTINENGDVGVIGGISQKVVAADKEGIEIFFAPKEGGNYNKAIKTAKEIKSDMKIIPVETFDDAVNYLQTLN